MSARPRCSVSPATTVTTLLAVSVLGARLIFFPAPRLVAHAAAPLVPVQPALQHIPATTGAKASAAGKAARVAQHRTEPRTVRRAAATTGRESAPRAGPPPPPPPPPPFPPLHPLIFMQRNIDEANCTALGGVFRNQVQLGGKRVIGKCKRRCTEDPPPSFTPRLPMPPLRFAPRAADGEMSSASEAAAASFAGHPTLEQRAAALRGCEGGGELACGFLAPSAFDAAVAAAPPHAHCRVVVLTAILGGSDRLMRPLAPIPRAQRGCFFAFVDAAARRGHEQAAGGEAWTLLPLRGALPFGANARRNSRIPKLLPHRLFPSAHFALWLDGKLQLRISPDEAVRRRLRRPSPASDTWGLTTPATTLAPTLALPTVAVTLPTSHGARPSALGRCAASCSSPKRTWPRCATSGVTPSRRSTRGSSTCSASPARARAGGRRALRPRRSGAATSSSRPRRGAAGPRAPR